MSEESRAKTPAEGVGSPPGEGAISSVTGDAPRTLVDWLLLIYKVPSEPSRGRVSIWRELKRSGGIYLQQAVCILPASPANVELLQRIRERITGLDGVSWYFEVARLPDAQQAELVQLFLEATRKEYAEIVEECETTFIKEIEFERYRENYTFEEAEEIRQDLEKLRRWFDKVQSRDWFGAPGCSEVETWLERCSLLLEEFEDDVYQRTKGEDDRAPDEA
jgi:hypothetical protein